MNKRVKTADLYPIIADAVSTGGTFDFIPGGSSMLPTINGTTDVVTLCRADNIVKGDIILFKRPNGQFILHRIIGINGNRLTVRGDNVYSSEVIDANEVLAKVCRFTTGKVECNDIVGSARRAKLHRPVVIARTVLTKIKSMIK